MLSFIIFSGLGHFKCLEIMQNISNFFYGLNGIIVLEMSDKPRKHKHLVFEWWYTFISAWDCNVPISMIANF